MVDYQAAMTLGGTRLTAPLAVLALVSHGIGAPSAVVTALASLPFAAEAEESRQPPAVPDDRPASSANTARWRWDIDALLGGQNDGIVLGVGVGPRRGLLRLGLSADVVGVFIGDRSVRGPGPDIARSGLDIAANICLVGVGEVATARGAFAGARWRADVVGELGQRWVWVSEIYPAGTTPDFMGHAGRYAPFAGVRLMFGGRLGQRFESSLGLGGFVRLSQTQTVVVDSGSRFERVGGWVIGAFAYVLLELPRDQGAPDAPVLK